MHWHIVALSAFFLISGCKSDTRQQLKGFSEYLENNGYSFYNPPRTDRGPGSVFRFARAESGKTIVSPVCKKLYAHIIENEASLTLPSEQSKSQLDIGFSASLIKDLLSGDPVLDAGWSSSSLINVNFTKVKSVYINEEDLYNNDGNARTITPSCYSALKRLSNGGELHENVFIVQESIRVDTLIYNAANSNSGKTGIQADIKQLFSFKPNINYSYNSNNNLEINEPRHVAFRAFLLKEYIDTGLKSAGSARIKAVPLDIDEINRRLKD